MANKQNKWNLVWYTLGITLWVVASVIASQLIVGYLAIILVGADIYRQPVGTAVCSALAYILAMALIILLPPQIMARKRGKATKNTKSVSRKELGLNGLFTWTDIGLAPVGFIVYLLAAAGITAVFSLFPWFDAGEAQDVGFNLIMSGGDRILAFVTLVIVAPVAEEIIFRGWLYGKLRNKYLGKMSDTAGMMVAILIVSLIFGLVHLQWNVGVNVFALSIILCGLREITGTIYAGILLHMLKNGVAFYLLYVLGV